MAHHYDIAGGSLLIIKYSGLTQVQFSFYIFDPRSKVAAYCWYGDKTVDTKKWDDANLNSQINRHQAGIGGDIAHLLQSNPLDLKRLLYAKCSLSLVEKATGSMAGTATLMITGPPMVQLIFPIVADFAYGFPAKTTGSLTQADIVKTRVPQKPMWKKPAP